jgi:hypothetical protein
MICPPDRTPFRATADGPMPMLVPASAIDWMRRSFPTIWMEELPADVPLLGRPLTLADLRKDAI